VHVAAATLKMEAIRSSETSVYTTSTWRHILEDGIFQIKKCVFLFKLISAHLNTFVASFMKSVKTVSKGLQRNSVQLGRYAFLNFFNIPKPHSFEGSFHLRKEPNIHWCELARNVFATSADWKERCRAARGSCPLL
jgi:hypothetical protein